MPTCLLLVDLQNDFMPGGALPVPAGDEVVAVANRIAPEFDLVVASQDWHPADHASFASQHAGCSPGEVVDVGGFPQVLWPDHCVQGSHGAGFHGDLRTDRIDLVVQKGTHREVDSYSAFFDNARRHATGLADELARRGVREVWLVGLATDYCVKFTALDAASLGFRVSVVEEGCRGIDLEPGDLQRSWETLRKAGVRIATLGRPRWRR